MLKGGNPGVDRSGSRLVRAGVLSPPRSPLAATRGLSQGRPTHAPVAGGPPGSPLRACSVAVAQLSDRAAWCLSSPCPASDPPLQELLQPMSPPVLRSVLASQAPQGLLFPLCLVTWLFLGETIPNPLPLHLHTLVRISLALPACVPRILCTSPAAGFPTRQRREGGRRGRRERKGLRSEGEEETERMKGRFHLSQGELKSTVAGLP